MKIKRFVSIQEIFVVLWALCFLFFRPSIFGERYNSLVFVVFALLTLFAINGHVRKLPSIPFKVFALILLVVTYWFIQGLALGSPRSVVINSSAFIALFSLTVLLVSGKYDTLVMRTFIWAHVVMAVSSIITMSMFIAGGFSDAGLIRLAVLNDFIARPTPEYSDSFSDHTLYFPFSVGWAGVGFGGIAIPRLTGIYREAGMAQIYFFTAFFLTYLVPVRHLRLVRIILFIGGVFTFSTSGMLSLIGGFLVMNYLPSMRVRITPIKVFALFVVVPCLVVLLLFLPDIGIMNKVISSSGNERTQSYLYSIAEFTKNPVFGQGYYKGFDARQADPRSHVDALGIIGILYQIGLVGITLYFLPWIYSVFHEHNRRTLFVLVPCFLTLFFSQPSYNDVLVWFLLLFNFKQIVETSAQPNIKTWKD